LGDVFSGIFEGFFGGGRGARGQRTGRRRGADLQIRHTISLKEVLAGTEATLKLHKKERCETCHGSGAKPGTGSKTCPECHGSGSVSISRGFITFSQTCQRCQGQGQVLTSPCSECRGAGVVSKPSEVKIRIPAGVEDGMTLRVTGAGEAGPQGGSPGDLYVLVQVKPEPGFERNGSDLISEIKISFPTAALGGEVTVPSLNGEVTLRIPAGTQPSTMFRLRDHGLPKLQSHGKGDLIVRVTIEVPTKLSNEQKQLLQEFNKSATPDKSKTSSNIFKRVLGE